MYKIMKDASCQGFWLWYLAVFPVSKIFSNCQINFEIHWTPFQDRGATENNRYASRIFDSFSLYDKLLFLLVLYVLSHGFFIMLYEDLRLLRLVFSVGFILVH